MGKNVVRLENLYKFEDRDNTVDIDDIVNIGDRESRLVKDTIINFKSTFIDRELNLSSKQINFATNAAKLIFGKQDNNKITVIPAKCGFGKSTIICEAMKTLYNNIGIGFDSDIFDGAIIVTDKISKLEEMAEKIGKGAYVLKYIELDDEMTEEDRKQETINQQAASSKYPILLMSSQRLSQLGDKISNYRKWYDRFHNEHERTLKIIDEKPQILDSENIDVVLISEIKKDIESIKVDNDEDNENKTYLIKEIQNIDNKIQDIKTELQDKNLWIYIGQQETLTTNDDKFFSCIKKYCKFPTIHKIEHLERLLTKGGLYINRRGRNQDNLRYFKTLGVNNLQDDFKTIIFDATATYDPDYADKNIFQFLKIDDERSFENLYIHNVPVNMSKSCMKQNNYKGLNLIGKYINRKFISEENIFLVTYKTIKGLLNSKLNIDIKRLEDGKIPHFGVTRGKNIWNDCTTMICLGFNRMQEIEYISSFLSLYIDLDKLFNACKNNNEFIENTCKKFELLKGKFKIENLNILMIMKIIVDFEQEIFRTKIRDFNDITTPINIYCFGMYEEMKTRIENRFNIKIIEEDEPIEFIQDKIMNRSNGGNAKKLYDWYSKWNDGSTIKTKDILKETGLNKNQLDTLKKENKSIKQIFDKIKTNKRGYYKKAS